MSIPFTQAPFAWNDAPFPPEAERLVLPDGRVLEDAVIDSALLASQAQRPQKPTPPWPSPQPAATSDGTSGWTTQDVERWAQSAEPDCRAAVRVLAATGLAIPTNDLNAAVGASSGGALLGGAQRWATLNNLPHAFWKDEAGGRGFVSEELRLVFREVLCEVSRG